MKYPFVFTIDEYAAASFERKCEIDSWLQENGIIPQITKDIKVFSRTFVEVTQYEVIDGQLVQEKGWPKKPKLIRRQFKVKGNAFPT